MSLIRNRALPPLDVELSISLDGLPVGPVGEEPSYRSEYPDRISSLLFGIYASTEGDRPSSLVPVHAVGVGQQGKRNKR